jgi:glycosyltransferase involved in cell wall biosynthesis
MAAGARVTLGGDNLGYRSVLAPWPETLFDPNDTEAFAELLNKAVLPSFYTKISKAQHDYVQQFDVLKVVDRLETVYGS